MRTRSWRWLEWFMADVRYKLSCIQLKRAETKLEVARHHELIARIRLYNHEQDYKMYKKGKIDAYAFIQRVNARKRNVTWK